MIRDKIKIPGSRLIAKATGAPITEKVSKDLEYLIEGGTIKAFSSPRKRCKIDNALKKDVLIPVLLQIHEKCPNGYKLLIENKHSWKIKIMNYNAPPFYESSNYYTYKDFDYKASPYAYTVHICPDQSTVNVDNYTLGSLFYKKQSLFCGILHVINNLAVPDKKLNTVSTICTSLNAQYSKKLDKIRDNYIQRLIKADCEIKKNWSGAVVINNYTRFYKSYIEIMNKHRCWIQMKLQVKDELSILDFSRSMLQGPLNNKDLVFYALMFYFGSEGEKWRLKYQEPELYNLIENDAVRIINDAAK